MERFICFLAVFMAVGTYATYWLFLWLLATGSLGRVVNGIFIYIAVPIFIIWLVVKLVSRKRTSRPLQLCASNSSDYVNWSRTSWNEWEAKDKTLPPLPSNPDKWTAKDYQRWEKQEWLRIIKQDWDADEDTESTSPCKAPLPVSQKPRLRALAETANNKTPKKPYTKAQLTPFALELFQELRQALPEDIASRLKCHRGFVTHGSYGTLFLFNIWDIHQTDVLHRNYFVYCLGYNPLKIPQISSKTWYLHLWINTVRLYRSQEEIRRVLEKDIKDACPKPFKFQANERFVEAKMEFEFKRPLEEWPDFMLPYYVKLISSLHPVLIPIIDAFTEPLTKEERKKAILGRKRKFYGPTTRLKAEKIREYTRSIPPSWRSILLKKHKYRCAHCKTSLKGKEAHMDHILPFSKGGGTTLENLQPLCGPCNLAKGNRLDY